MSKLLRVWIIEINRAMQANGFAYTRDPVQFSRGAKLALVTDKSFSSICADASRWLSRQGLARNLALPKWACFHQTWAALDYAKRQHARFGPSDLNIAIGMYVWEPLTEIGHAWLFGFKAGPTPMAYDMTTGSRMDITTIPKQCDHFFI